MKKNWWKSEATAKLFLKVTSVCALCVCSLAVFVLWWTGQYIIFLTLGWCMFQFSFTLRQTDKPLLITHRD